MSRDAITIYETPARYITVICGNSGILYPFYCSLGKNSLSPETWFPWMGYFLQNPTDPRQIYMAKPEVQEGISQGVQKIIEQFLSEPVAKDLIYRMGNDEAVALSCSLGGGVWKSVPGLKQAIQELETIKKYLKDFCLHKTIADISIPQEQQRLVSFEGKQGKFEKIASIVVAVAKAMENITTDAYMKLIKGGKRISLNVQDEQVFPSNEKVAQVYEQRQPKYSRRWGFHRAKQVAKPYPEANLAAPLSEESGIKIK